MHAKSRQSCPTLCYPMDHSPPGSSVHGNSPGKNTEMGCHALLQGIFPDSGIKHVSLTSPALTGGFFLPLVPRGKPASPACQLEILSFGSLSNYVNQFQSVNQSTICLTLWRTLIHTVTFEQSRV